MYRPSIFVGCFFCKSVRFYIIQVQRLNLKTWQLDDIQSMAKPRAGLLTVYLGGFIYAISVTYNEMSFERLTSIYQAA